MVKIKVNRKTQTDVNEMIAKGWRVCVYREHEQVSEFITAEKNAVRFVIRHKDEGGVPMVEVRKYIAGTFKESKVFYNPNCNINGTLYISEGKNADTTYAFFRNETLQNLMDDFGIRKVVFPKESGKQFSKVVYNDTMTEMTPPPFHTDGTFEFHNEIANYPKYDISGATYVYEYLSCVLTIPQVYDCEKIREKLNEIME